MRQIVVGEQWKKARFAKNLGMVIEFGDTMELMQDARLAMRTFWKTPVFTAVAILTLTLAIGANTAIFSILNALVLRDLPVREPASLISLARVTPATADGAFSLPMFRAIAQRQQSLSALIGWTSNAVINIEINSHGAWRRRRARDGSRRG